MFKKNLCLISNFAITCILCIYGVICAIVVEDVLDGMLAGTGGHTNWSVAIIIGCALIIFFAILGLISNFSLNKEGNKVMQNIILGVGIILLITTVLFYVNILSSAYSNTLDLSGSIDEEMVTQVMMKAITNTTYNETFLIMLFASLSSLVAPIISLVFMRGECGNVAVAEGDKVQPAQDENAYVKAEIEKLKKQLELEELKKEYVSLYKQVSDKENK